MKLPRFSVRRLMIAIALLAISYASARWVIVGDGWYDVRLVNGLGTPVRDVELSSNGVILAADALSPDGELRGRLRAGHFSRSGMLQSDIEVSYRLDGRNCRTSASFGISMIRAQPDARFTLVDHFGTGVLELKGSNLPISSVKSWLRSWWFWLFNG